MRIAYFVNQYPKVSHSFIRREILALEKLGYQVERFALRTDEAELIDCADQLEVRKVSYVLSESKIRIVLTSLAVFVSRPLKFLSTFLLAIKMGFRSERGVLRHLAYFLESCVVLKWEQKTGVRHIHAHFGTNSTAVVMFAHLLGGPGYSFTVHGPEEFDKPEFISLAEKIKRSRFVVAISSYGRSQLFRWTPIEQWPKIKVVHCGLDDAYFSGNDSSRFACTGQLVCVGRLCEQKGQLILLEAVKRLVDSGYQFSFILAGDGPMRKDLQQRIELFGLQEIVKITGWCTGEQVREIILNSRGLVLPSFAEGLPVVIMEAMALKRPVISTYVAGIPELVKHDDNGWLVPAGDVGALAAAIRRLLDADDNRLKDMGEKGYQAVLKQHHIDTEARKLAGYFAEFDQTGAR